MKNVVIAACLLASAACSKPVEESRYKKAGKVPDAFTQKRAPVQVVERTPDPLPAPKPEAVVEKPPKAEMDDTAKLEGVAWAKEIQDIKGDPSGMWAISATASSTASETPRSPKSEMSASRAIGLPKVDETGETGNAWCTGKKGFESLELGYRSPVRATAVRVHLPSGSTTLNAIELIDTAGESHPVWEGKFDGTGNNLVNYANLKIPMTPYAVNKVKLRFATNLSEDKVCVDAVQLVGVEVLPDSGAKK